VARLWNGDHIEAVLAKQHHSFSSIVVSPAKRCGVASVPLRARRRCPTARRRWPRKIRKTRE
jgi:hypothetical protein